MYLVSIKQKFSISLNEYIGINNKRHLTLTFTKVLLDTGIWD